MRSKSDELLANNEMHGERTNAKNFLLSSDFDRLHISACHGNFGGRMFNLFIQMSDTR
jgi:hypothetical protein